MRGGECEGKGHTYFMKHGCKQVYVCMRPLPSSSHHITERAVEQKMVIVSLTLCRGRR